ncbi:MAG: alkaline phosphatase family protein [Pirellulaceae bacterium]
MNSGKRKLLLIGWDAADWKVIHPLLDTGKMPHLESLINRGAMGNLRTLHPVLSPMLWTSIATGKRPFKHGILGFVEPAPDGMNVRPISNRSRKTKTLWNILNQNNQKTNVVGWWPSHPVEPINGIMVSDQFAKHPLTPTTPEKWAMPPDSVHPEEMANVIRELRFHPSEITAEIMRPFIPDLEKVNQNLDSRLATCMKVLCECTSLHSVATHVLENSSADFTAIYYDAIDHFSHGFMRYHPPKLDSVRQADFDLYKNVINTAYQLHDMMLGRLLELIDEETAVIVMSDHGFHPDHLRPNIIPSEPAGPAIEHRDHGIFVMAGPGICRDQLITGMTLLDIAPSILHYLGYPVGEDMDGRVIQSLFEVKQPVVTIPSWDTVGPPPESFLSDNIDVDDHEANQRGLKQLVELGYVDEIDPNQQSAVERAINELKFNLARAYMDAGQFQNAVEPLAELYRTNSSQYRYGIQLAMCLKSLNQVDALETLVAQLNETRRHDSAIATEKLSRYESLIRDRRADRVEKLKADPSLLKQFPEKDRKRVLAIDNLLTLNELKEFSEVQGLANATNFALDFLQGYALIGKGKYHEGLALLNDAIRKGGPRPSFLGLVGETLLTLKDYEAAEEAFSKGLKLDPNSAALLLGLGWVSFRKKRYSDAVSFARQSIGLRFHQPSAHFLMGIALQHLKKNEEAVSELKLAVSQNPNFAMAHSRLGYHYKSVGEQILSYQHFELAKEARLASRASQQQSIEIAIADVAVDCGSDKILPERNEQFKATNLLPTLSQSPAGYHSERHPQAPPSETVTIVSGLPRSGTSMLMQMLSAGGMPIWTDGLRSNDDDNPLGYLELNAVKGLASDNRFILDARGKVVKVVASLLHYIPSEVPLRILFMERDLDEILASQQKMLLRNRKPTADFNSKQMRTVVARQKTDAIRMIREKAIPILGIPYSGVINDPIAAAKRIVQFLNISLNESAMSQAVAPSLYRNRSHSRNEIERS